MRRKIIILSSIIILIAVLASAGIFYLRRKNPLMQISLPKNQADLRAEFEKKITQDNLSTPNSNRPEEFRVSTTECEVITDNDRKKNCLDYVAYLEAVAAADFGKCAGLSGELADICLFKIIITKQADFEKCSSIKNPTVHDFCFENASIFSIDKKLCEKLSSDEKIVRCQDKLISLRVDSGDINQCALIKNPGLFATCVLNNQKPCSEFTDSNLSSQCDAWRLFDKIINNGESQYCDILIPENFKKVCNIYFQKNKYADSDLDSMSDREELERGTDPFVFNEELKKIKEEEKTAFSINRFLREMQNEIKESLSVK